MNGVGGKGDAEGLAGITLRRRSGGSTGVNMAYVHCVYSIAGRAKWRWSRLVEGERSAEEEGKGKGRLE